RPGGAVRSGRRRRADRAGLGRRRRDHQLRDRHPARCPGAAGVRRMRIELPDTDATRALGERLAASLRAGDLVVLVGDLGAGKTTLTQGIGAGLGVRGQIASPTFIIARAHPSLGDGPDLVHVDAYRIGSLEEVDALDFDSSLEESGTVVEWAEGLVGQLGESGLEVRLERPRASWQGVDTRAVAVVHSEPSREGVQPRGPAGAGAPARAPSVVPMRWLPIGTTGGSTVGVGEVPDGA